jgi:hypothetical protein
MSNEENKIKVLAALDAAGIKEVEVEYSGSGDSGQIEDTTFVRRNALDAMGEAVEGVEEEVVAEDQKITVSEETSRFENGGWVKEKKDVEKSLKEAVEELCYDYLPGGWEINEGSDGTFSFDVKAGTISHTHHNHYMETETTEEEL